MFDNCFFVSNVDDGWYASGPDRGPRSHAGLWHLADGLIAPMNFGIV